MLEVVNTTGNGSLTWVMSPSVANRASTKLNSGGDRTFPDLSPTGGEMLGLPALVTNQVPTSGSPATGSLMLIDGTGIAADGGSVELDMSDQASVESVTIRSRTPSPRPRRSWSAVRHQLDRHQVYGGVRCRAPA